MRKSVFAIALGVFLALAVGLLVVFGILAPTFTRFFGVEFARMSILTGGLLFFSVAFAFYWGGMISSYRAPGRRRTHGTLVAPAAFAISPIVNLATGEGMFPNVDTPRTVIFLLSFLIVSVAAAYVGALRGEALYAYNRRFARRNIPKEKSLQQGGEGS